MLIGNCCCFAESDLRSSEPVGLAFDFEMKWINFNFVLPKQRRPTSRFGGRLRDIFAGNFNRDFVYLSGCEICFFFLLQIRKRF